MEQEFAGYDLAYSVDHKERHQAEFCLVDFDRQVKTTVTYHRDALTSSASSYIVIQTEEISGTMDTEWVDLYESTDSVLSKTAVYSRIIEVDGEQVIQDFQKFNVEKREYEEKIIKTKKIADLETYIERFRILLDKESKKIVDKYDSLFPRED